MLSINLEQLKKNVPLWLGNPDCGSNESIVSTSEGESEDEVPVPKNMQELVQHIKGELGIYGLDSDKVNVDKIMKLMSNYQSNSEDWKKYAHFDKDRYTRNLVDDGNGEFNLLVLCWAKGQQSPIHDHAGSHCIMKILDGELKESQFDWPDKTDTCMLNTKNTIYSRDQVTYISDKIGLHRVGNPSDQNALSLHLYTPPIKQAITFQESTAQPRSAGTCGFYSINGKII